MTPFPRQMMLTWNNSPALYQKLDQCKFILTTFSSCLCSRHRFVLIRIIIEVTTNISNNLWKNSWTKYWVAYKRTKNPSILSTISIRDQNIETWLNKKYFVFVEQCVCSGPRWYGLQQTEMTPRPCMVDPEWTQGLSETSTQRPWVIGNTGIFVLGKNRRADEIG